MDTGKICNYAPVSLWIAIVFAAAGWMVLILGIVFLSLAMHNEKSRRRRAQTELVVAKTTRPRPIFMSPTAPERPMNTAPIRPTDLPIRDPFIPKPPAPEPLKLTLPPPGGLPRNVTPNGFTYLPNGVLNENNIRNSDSMFHNQQIVDRWGASQSRAYTNQGYED